MVLKPDTYLEVGDPLHYVHTELLYILMHDS